MLEGRKTVRSSKESGATGGGCGDEIRPPGSSMSKGNITQTSVSLLRICGGEKKKKPNRGQSRVERSVPDTDSNGCARPFEVGEEP